MALRREGRPGDPDSPHPLPARDEFRPLRPAPGEAWIPLLRKNNVILVVGTGTGKTHLAIAIARQAVINDRRARFFNLLDLVNQLEQEKLAGRGGKLADSLARLDLVVLDELGYLPFSKSGGQLLFHLISKLYERTSLVITTNLTFASGHRSLLMRK